MEVQLVDGHLAEESGAADIGLPYSMVKRLRRPEAEIHSPAPVESSDSSMPSAMVVHCYFLESYKDSDQRPPSCQMSGLLDLTDRPRGIYQLQLSGHSDLNTYNTIVMTQTLASLNLDRESLEVA